MAISPELQKILDNLATDPSIGGKSSAAYLQLTKVINDSPVLADQLNQAVAAGHLKTINLMAADTNAGAEYNGSTKTISLGLDTLNNPKKEASLIFQFAHETQHGFASIVRDQARDNFTKEVIKIARSPDATHDYSNAYQTVLKADSDNEAKAEIAGWNALVSSIKQTNPNPTLQNIYDTTRYTHDFISRDGTTTPATYTLKDGLTLKTDLSMEMEASRENIDAMGQHYYHLSASKAGIGSRGDSDYTNYHAAYYTSVACQYEAAYAKPSTKMMLDMDKLGLNEEQMEHNGINLGGDGKRCTYYDTNTPATPRYFDHTSEGSANEFTHVPIRPQNTDLSESKGVEKQQLSPEIQALHDKIGGFLYPTLEKSNVSQNHADSMVATAVQEAVGKKITADEVLHAGVDKTKNLIGVFTKEVYKVAAFDAVEASKNDPEKTLTAAQQQLEQQPAQELQKQQQQLEQQTKERSGQSMGM